MDIYTIDIIMPDALDKFIYFICYWYGVTEQTIRWIRTVLYKA